MPSTTLFDQLTELKENSQQLSITVDNTLCSYNSDWFLLLLCFDRDIMTVNTNMVG